MTRDAIIDQFARDPEYKSICRQISGDQFDADDLYQELVMFVLQIPEDKLQRLNETCLKCFFYRMAYKQFNSTRSAYHYTIRRDGAVVKKHQQDIARVWMAGEFPEELYERVEEILDKTDWVDVGITKLYSEGPTLKELSKQTLIPIKSLHDSITRVKKVVKKKIRRYE